MPRWRASIRADLPRTLTLSADLFKPSFGDLIPVRHDVACNVDASETMDAAGQLGADAAVPGGAGRAADWGAGHGPAGSAAGCANADAAGTRGAEASGADPRRATFPEHAATGRHAGRPRHRTCSLGHRDCAATSAAGSAAAGSRQPFTCARARGASAGSRATHGLTVHFGRSGR